MESSTLWDRVHSDTASLLGFTREGFMGRGWLVALAGWIVGWLDGWMVALDGWSDGCVGWMDGCVKTLLRKVQVHYRVFNWVCLEKDFIGSVDRMAISTQLDKNNICRRLIWQRHLMKAIDTCNGQSLMQLYSIPSSHDQLFIRLVQLYSISIVICPIEVRIEKNPAFTHHSPPIPPFPTNFPVLLQPSISFN